jgi:YD repeat-containing protein
VEGLPGSTSCATTLTAPARRITTQWHGALRLPALIAKPLKITSLTYDTVGNVLTRTEQATTDTTGTAGAAATKTGAARVWTYTFNTAGKMLTSTGPRRDVNDTTTYVYDGNGNATSVTNAIGQVTTMSNYDANGRVGRIASPNGVVTVLTYGPRGWVTDRSDTAGGVTQSTGYEYDGVGQLKKITFPDGAYVAYTYDNAHRLTGLSDSVGNTTQYTLDYRGNRIAEQSRDPAGALARQVKRVYDNLNQLMNVTGSAQ